jgi:peptide-methionine (R)-S-oxide reductase
LLKIETKIPRRANSVVENKKGRNKKLDRRAFLKSGMLLGALTAFSGFSLGSTRVMENLADKDGDKLPFEKVVKTDAEWKRILTPEQYQIARKGGTEKPYSSPLNKNYRQGVYNCVCCDLPLFSSKTKYNSNTGWASFYAPIAKINIREKVDNSLPETRTEVLCNRCDAHLGHVFDDGPKPTGLRYCINGVAMKFIRKNR